MSASESEDDFLSASEGEGSDGEAQQAARDAEEGDELWEDEILPSVTPVAAQDDLRPEDAMEGVRLFFCNKFKQSEDYFAKGKDSMPLFAVSYGAVSLLKALMTFDETDRKQAIQRLNHAEALANVFAGGEGAVKSIARKMLFMGSEKLTTEQVSARIVVSEARLARSLLLFLEESISGFVKAGIGMRRAWKGYEACGDAVKKNKAVNLTKCDEGGIQFGLGVFNMVLSILPHRVLKVVSLMGFKANREEGLRDLTLCFEGGEVRSPLAAIALLAYHALLPSFFSVPQVLDFHIQEGTKVLNTCLEQYPNGAIFMFIKGRLERLKKDLVASVNALRVASDAVPRDEWRPFYHLCAYELGWSLCQQSHWEEGRAEWDMLKTENRWSRAFYAYMSACCSVQLQDKSAALASFAEALQLTKDGKKFGGKQMSVDQFVARKLQSFKLHTQEGIESRAADMAMWEMLYLWNSMTVFGAAELNAVIQACDAVIEACQGDNEMCVVPLLLKGSALNVQGNKEDCEETLIKAANMEGSLKHDTYAAVYAKYELGVALLGVEGREEECLRWLQDAAAVKYDYNFEVRLKLRLAGATHHAKKALKAAHGK